MIKQITLLFKKPSITVTEFNQYWKEIYGPLFARTAPGLRKYVQNHFVETPGKEYRGHGIEALWFDDLQSQRKCRTWLRSEESKELRNEAALFLEVGREVIWLTEEHELIRGGDGYKFKEIGLGFKKSNMTRNAYNDYWLNKHGPMSVGRMPCVRKYCQNHLLPLPGVKWEGDGIGELWFDNAEARNRFLAYYETSEASDLVSDVANFGDLNHEPEIWLAEEYVIK